MQESTRSQHGGEHWKPRVRVWGWLAAAFVWVGAVAWIAGVPKSGQSEAGVPGWVVQLSITRGDGTARCTGVFVAERTVLTAWHCLDGASRVAVSVDGEIATAGTTWHRRGEDVGVVETVSGAGGLVQPLGVLREGAASAHGLGGGEARTCRGDVRASADGPVVWCGLKPGSSGGPVVQDGAVVGIVTRGGQRHIVLESVR